MAAQTPSSSSQISAKDATNRAASYAVDLLGNIHSVRLEEVELSEDGREWLITLSYFANTPYVFGQKEYKIFRVDAHSGEVKSMKIREV
ncbi:MAG: hypothetical protein AMXMBFR13_27500 [Phycisphaerae bacterium]